MKLKATFAAAALLLAPGLHAFTLDFASSVGSSIPSTLVVNLPTYGDVSFAAGYNAVLGAASTLEVGTAFFGAPAIQFDNGDTLVVTFLGSLPSGVDFSSLALSVGGNEQFIVLQTGPSEYIVSLQNSTNGAAIGGVTFTADAVPEPSAALLGLIGAAGIVIRRRR